MDFMAGLDDNAFDLAIVDPPYGINVGVDFSNEKHEHTKSFVKGYPMKDWDESTPNKSYFNILFRISKNQIIWGGNYFIDYLTNTRCMIFWDKNNGTNNFADGEIAWTSFNKSVRKYTQRSIAPGRIHPTQKPVCLYDWLLQNYATPEMRILDTHLGSGSSAISAHYFGCDFVGCEIDKEYFELAQNRFDHETRQLSLDI